jgi:hypothetical protein
MNRNDFLNILDGTVPVNRQMLGEVYELIDIFPYFQSAHLILLKGLHTNADVKFENQLRNSAIHVGDREVLYWLLRNKNSSETEKAGIKEVTELKEEIVSDTQQTVIETAKNSEYMITEIEKSSEEAKSGEKSDPTDHTSVHSVMIATEPDNTEPAGVILLLDEETTSADDKVFFMDPSFSIPERSDLLELDLDEDSEDIFSVDETVEENLNNAGKNSNKQMQSELIDKFIIANPRIEPVRDKTSVPTEDISKPFIEESGGLVTETLAKIYVSQGYYSKAMDIYEKLSLKFPEKSSYFASQIEKVKEYIKK